MIPLTVQEAIDFVRLSIDEISLNDASFDGYADTDSGDLDEIIKGKMAEAVRFAHMGGQVSIIGPDALFMDEDEIKKNCKVSGDEMDVVEIAFKDILRLVRLKMKDSKVAVTAWHDEDSAMGHRQHDKYAKGTFQRPVAINAFGKEHATLRYYSLRTSAPEDADILEIVDYVSYLPEPKMENGSIAICPGLRTAILNYLTGLVLLVFKDQHAENFFNLAKTHM